MRKCTSCRETMKQAAEDIASQHEWSHRMALQIKSLPVPPKTPQEPFLPWLFFRCWQRWTQRGLIKGRFPWESVRPAVLFAQSDMQPGHFFFFVCLRPMCLPYFSPQGALSLEREDGQAWRRMWNRQGASHFSSYIMNMFALRHLGFGNWFDQGEIDYISTTVVQHQFSISLSLNALVTSIKFSDVSIIRLP